MILASATTAGYLTSSNYTVKPWVWVAPHGIPGAAQDMSSRVESFTITASLDNSVMAATVNLFVGSGSDSLSPFYSGSIHQVAGQPLCAPAAGISLGFTIGKGADYGETILVFQGRVDRVSASWKDGLVTLECRDAGSWWLNTWLMTPGPYGLTGGQECSQVMQAIMDAARDSSLGTEVPNLLSSNPSPVYLVYPQYPEPGPVLEILKTIALQAGRDVRWFQSANGLLYYEPNRLVNFPDLVIGPIRYESITELAWGDEDVRNILEVYYQGVNGDYGGPAFHSDPDSINKYGPRRFRVFLDRAENITNTGDADRFAGAAIADQSEPFATHAISMPLEPRVELNDYHQYLSGPLSDTDFSFAVAAFRHEYKKAQSGQPGITRTTIGARAKPMAAYRNYRLSKPKTSLVSKSPPPDTLWAPEGSVYYQVDSLD